MTYTIRPAKQSDLPDLPGIELAAATLFPPEDVPENVRGAATSLAEFEHALEAGMLWVAATADNTPVGFAHLVPMESHIHLEELDVHPEHGKRGLGAKLVAAAIDWSRARGYPAVTLTTFSHVPWNAPFYERMGFRRLAESELSNGLREEIHWEAEQGLDRAKRVAMRLEL